MGFRPPGVLGRAHPRGLYLDSKPVPPPIPGTHYVLTQSAGVLVPGTTDTGNHGAYASFLQTPFVFPFPISFYGQTFVSGSIGCNGSLQFLSASTHFGAFPDSSYNYGIVGFLRNELADGPGEGIFYTVSGAAPSRVLHLQWITEEGFGGTIIFEMRFFEGDNSFEIYYGAGTSGAGGIIGIQKDTGSDFVVYGINAPQAQVMPANGQKLVFSWVP